METKQITGLYSNWLDPGRKVGICSWIVLVVVALVFGLGLAGVAHAGEIDISGMNVMKRMTINAGQGDQYDPHVSGDLVAVTCHIKLTEIFTLN